VSIFQQPYACQIADKCLVRLDHPREKIRREEKRREEKRREEKRREEKRREEKTHEVRLD
jgi:hypothetical protein